MGEIAATSPLHYATSFDGAVEFSVRSEIGALNIRGAGDPFFDTVVRTLGAKLPEPPNTAEKTEQLRLLWLGPDEWLLQAPHDRISEIERALARALIGHHHAVTDVSDQSLMLHLAGRQSRDVLAFGCPLDLHNVVFRPGMCAQSRFLKAGIILCQVDDEPSYDIIVLRSLAEYLWSVLSEAAAALD